MKMLNNDIRVDFDRLDYSIVKKKDFLAFMILAIIGFSFALIVIPFLIIWLVQAPIEINNVIRQADEPEYIEFMTIFLSIFGSLTVLILISLLITYKNQAKDYIIIDKDINLNRFYEVILNNKSLFISESKTFYFRHKNETIDMINDYQAKDQLRNKYLFWEKWKNLDNYKILNKKKKTVLVFKEKIGRTVLYYRYYFSNDGSYLPGKITEIISNQSANTRSNQRISSYVFTENNKAVNRHYHRKVLDIINSND